VEEKLMQGKPLQNICKMKPNIDTAADRQFALWRAISAIRVEAATGSRPTA